MGRQCSAVCNERRSGSQRAQSRITLDDGDSYRVVELSRPVSTKWTDAGLVPVEASQ